LKLYHSAASPNSRRVRIFLAEKGLKVPLVAVDLGKGEQHSEAYRAINPRRVVPTLVLEDGTAIGEVPAIMRYLDEAFPESPLPGATPKDKGLIAMWERRAELEGFAAVMEGVRNKIAGLKGRAIAGPLPTASFARRLTPHSVEMSDEIIGPLPQNDFGRLSVRDRVGLLRKGLLIRLRIHHSRKNGIRG
jgi:glutathione S-transferase